MSKPLSFRHQKTGKWFRNPSPGSNKIEGPFDSKEEADAMPRPEPQNRIALPPLSAHAELCRDEGLLCIPLQERERQLLSRMQSLARIHALALDLTKSPSQRRIRSSIAEIVRLSNPNAAE